MNTLLRIIRFLTGLIILAIGMNLTTFVEQVDNDLGTGPLVVLLVIIVANFVAAFECLVGLPIRKVKI